MARERTDLLHDAVKINGYYIEDLVTGYRTIKATGRESLAKEIEMYESAADGARLKSSRFPERSIEIEFHVHRGNLADLRESMHKLQTVLNVENAQIIFNDDYGCYYTGTPIMDNKIEDFKNAASGTFVITCLDPFKYSLTETTVNLSTYSETVKDEEGNVSTITSRVLTTNNQGGYKTFPTFDVQFATDEDAQGGMGSDADCGYVLLAKGGTDYSIQIGNDAEKDTTTVTEVAQDFKKTRGSFNGLNTPTPPSTTYSFQGSSKIETAAANGPGLKVNGYGTAQTKKFYGPLVVYDIGHDLTGAFDFTWKQVTACHKNTATGKKQQGALWVFFLDSNNVIKYGVGVQKAKDSTLAAAVYYYTTSSGLIRYSDASLEYTNWMGFKSDTDTVGRLGTNYIRRYQDSDGEWVVSFKLNLLNDDSSIDISDSPVNLRKVGFFFGRWGTTGFFSNRVTEAKLVNGNFDNVNTFSSGDLAVVDVGAAEIKLNTAVRNDLGDYANDWSDMYLDVGANTIYTQHSDWVTPGFEPNITMKYRKRWL